MSVGNSRNVFCWILSAKQRTKQQLGDSSPLFDSWFVCAHIKNQVPIHLCSCYHDRTRMLTTHRAWWVRVFFLLDAGNTLVVDYFFVLLRSTREIFGSVSLVMLNFEMHMTQQRNVMQITTLFFSLPPHTPRYDMHLLTCSRGPSPRFHQKSCKKTFTLGTYLYIFCKSSIHWHQRSTLVFCCDNSPLPPPPPLQARKPIVRPKC
jgi:hypothetical protein